MQFPFVKQVRRPLYVFSEDGLKTHPDKFRGLLRHSPLRPAQTKEPNYVFIFQQDDRDFANKLYLSLRNGIESFPGSHQFVGLPISTDRVQPIRLPPEAFRPGKEPELREAVIQHIAGCATRPDFAYIIGDHNWKYQRPSPYGAIKAALLQNSIPSQMVTKQLMQVESQFRFALPNIALSVLVKLGGIPWLVRRIRESPALVIGIGTTQIATPLGNTRQKVLGYAVCMLSTGMFLDLSFFGAATSYEAFLPRLTNGLGSTLDRLKTMQAQVGKVSLHVSHFERRETIDAVTSLLDQRKQEQPTPVPFEVLRLSHDSEFMVMDLDDSGFVAEEGIVVGLAPRHSLVVMEGKREKAPWRGRKPVTLEVHREYISNPAAPFAESLEEVFHLGFVNWRGFGTKTKPATLAYAKLLADRVADIAAVAPDLVESLGENPSFGTSLWFL